MIETRILRKEDIAAVAEIEARCFSEPWSPKSLELLCEEDAFGIVATVDGVVAAYGGMTYVLDEGTVTNVATHPDYRRRGLARRVLGEMIREAVRYRGVETIFLEVRASNLIAQELYLSAGFSALGRRRGFYSHPREDAIQMMYGGAADREDDENEDDTELW